MNKVLAIHGSELYGIISETGCSTATSSKLMDVAGASKTVYYAIQPYSKIYEEKRYGHFPRSVSKEFIDSVLEKESELNPDVNFILASSWQLHSDTDPLQIPHGWYGLFDIKRNVKYVLHFTFNRRITESYCDLCEGKHNPKRIYEETRERLIDMVGHIGVNLLHTTITGNINEFDINAIPNASYIALDIAYTNNKLDIDFLINTLEKSEKDYFLVFKDNKAIRLEDFVREGNSCTIQKGSFNPIHHGHVEMMDCSKKQHNTSQAFLISTYRYDKPHISEEELEERIKQINGVGYTLIVCKSVFFYDTFKLFNYWTYNKQFYFPVGMDTMVRINQTDSDYVNSINSKVTNNMMRTTIRGYVDKIINSYPNCKFLVFKRKGYEQPEDVKLYSRMCEYIDREDDGVSSTAIRQGTVQNKLNINGVSSL